MLVLAALYVALQIVADITVVKMVTILGYVIPAGSLVYALTFTVRDLIHKRLGKEYAKGLIVLAGLINVAMAGWFIVVGRMAAPEWWVNQQAYDLVLGIIPRIVLASIAAEVVSELVDTEVYHWWVLRVTQKHQWLRVLVSNSVAGVIDAALFGALAFYGTMPLAALYEIIKGGALFKVLLAVPMMWTIYVVQEEG
jgi:uncharacterized integral membrane protein (TIGR00697 family)